VAFLGLWSLASLSARTLGRPAMLYLHAPWGGLAAGALAGTLQWVLLSGLLPPRLRGDAWWPLATALGMGVGSFAQGLLAPVLAALCIEGAGGLAQGVLLRRSLRGGEFWLLATVLIAGPAAAAAQLAAGWLAARNNLLVAQLLAGALQGMLIGAVTGPALLALWAHASRARLAPRPTEADGRPCP